MSVLKIKRTGADGRERHTGWQARIRIYERLPNGLPASELTPSKKNFLFADGFNKQAAEDWENEQLKLRREIEQARRGGRALPASSITRTVDELADRYYNDVSFLSLRARSQTRIRQMLSDFLEWNRVHGRPYADQWTRELAKERLKYIWATYSGKGRQLHAGYEKKLFALELDREDRSIDRNPFPPIKQTKKKRRLTKPRSFTPEEIAALRECSEPYDDAVWMFLLNTGLREQEYVTLQKSRVRYRGSVPVEILIEDHTGKIGEGTYDFAVKNGRDREIPLNRAAREALVRLLAFSDDSGFVLRRQWLAKSHAMLRNFEQLKRRVTTKYPHMKDALWASGDSRATPHTFRKTFATNLIASGASVTTVANLLGDDVETVLFHYAAVLDQDKAEAVHKLDRSEQHLEHLLEELIRTHGATTIADQISKRTSVIYSNVA